MAALGGLSRLAAQGPPPLEDLTGRERPRLSSKADTNSWEAYFDYGVSVLRRQPSVAEVAFHWAHRLDPTRAEPLYARWVAYWMRHIDWWERYVEESKTVVNSPNILRVDSLYTRALLRNPFVAQTLTALLYDQLPGQWSRDVLTQAMLEYSAGKLPEAARDFARAIRRNPRRWYLVHYDRALAFTGMERWDSAAAEMDSLLAELRSRDTSVTARVYQSRELLLYGAGLLKLVLRDRAGGRAAMEEALVQNFVFYPAHVMLGQQALDAGDPRRGLAEFSQAVELSRGDSWVRYLYARALAFTGNARGAIVQLDSVARAEPLFAEPWLTLGTAREAAGEVAEARAAYETFLRLAPRSAEQQIAFARGRLAALDAGGP